MASILQWLFKARFGDGYNVRTLVGIHEASVPREVLIDLDWVGVVQNLKILRI